ncbi:MAG TPA: amidohydrolase family protein, partial [Polyangia bacterium]
MRFGSGALVLLALGVVAHAAEAPAELVLRGGDILTQDPAHPHARAVAVRGGFIVALDDVDTLIGPKTRVIELAGRAVVPSLTDAHAHLAGLGFAAAMVDLRGCSSADDCARRVTRAVDEGRGARGGWVMGRGWDQNRFFDGRFPTHAALDRIARPVFLERVDGHAVWVNTAALRAARVDRATKDPPGGKIARDDRGEPTGVFVDNAMSLVDKAIPAPTATEIEAAIVRGQALALQEGLTEVHDMGVDGDTAAAYARL